MRISDWSSDVCSSDLPPHGEVAAEMPVQKAPEQVEQQRSQEYQGEGQMPASRHGKAIMARDCCPIRETRKHQPGVIVIGAALPPIQARVGVEYAQAAHQQYGHAEMGRAHVRTPVTNAHLVCRLLLATKKSTQQTQHEPIIVYHSSYT